MRTALPLVLCLSGHDPTGGAGIHADIEAAAANGAHALTLITAQTAQDSRNVAAVQPVPVAWLQQQLALLLDDCRPSAIKVGLLGDAAQVTLIADLARRLRVPLVLDPVLRAGGGAELAGTALLAALRAELLPLVTVLTPNAAEARRLAPTAADLDGCGAALLAAGCANVLITGGDEPDAEVHNRWYRRDAAVQRYRWPRLPETFHGAGCTLASAIAAQLARGVAVGEALTAAQTFTQRSLADARRVGHGRRIPGRLR